MWSKTKLSHIFRCFFVPYSPTKLTSPSSPLGQFKFVLNCWFTKRTCSLRKIYCYIRTFSNSRPESTSQLINFLVTAKTCRSTCLQMLFITFVLSVFTFNFVFWHLSIYCLWPWFPHHQPYRMLCCHNYKRKRFVPELT